MPDKKNVWTTADGRELEISSMSDIHVLRIIRMAESRLVEIGLTAPKNALEAHFREVNIEAANVTLKRFKAEAEKRKLGGWIKFGVQIVKRVLG